MITVPEDPVQLWINRAHRLALTLMDEPVTISVGMNTPNQIVTTEFGFEALETEPDPNKLKGIARQLSRLKQRTHMQLDPWLLAQGVRRLKRTTR